MKLREIAVVGCFLGGLFSPGCVAGGALGPRVDLVPIRPQQSSREWAAVETVTVRWPSGRLQTITVEQTNEERSQRLRIRVEGNPDFLLSVSDGLVTLADGIMSQRPRRLNSVRATYLLMPRNLRSARGGIVLIVTGWAYASDPGSFRALALNDGELPRELLESDTFELADIVDLDMDGVPEIVGKHSLSQLWGPCFATYDPFTVYRLTASLGAKAERSLELSERYNRVHHYGWVGPDASEDWAVVKCAPGGPRIMKATEAVRLFGK